MSEVIESNDPAVQPERKYFVEAAKRKRAEGTKQYEQLHFSDNDRLRSLADDPWADHAKLDALPLPLNNGDRIKFLITGAGIGGIVMAIKLIKNGFSPKQILLVEAAGGVGGTWYWNRYPGLYCDIEAYCYMPYLEESGYMPKQKYGSSVEIRTHLEDLVKRFDLEDRILYRSQVSDLTWGEDQKAWKTSMTVRREPAGKDSSTFFVQAEFVALASGLFPYPQVPRVSGLADFKGQMFHTSRWNYNITGGTCEEVFPDMEKLKDARVGIIGTGATAVQVVPQLAKHAKEVYVFQRTPSMVHTRGQRDTDPIEWREKIAYKPGWQKERVENLAENIACKDKPDNDLVNDKWSGLDAYCALVGSNRFGAIAPEKAQEHIGTMLALDADQTRKARERIQEVVKDKEVADKLTPWYPAWCKRPTFSDTYLESFNEANVHLVDTNGKGIERVTPQGIIVDGSEYPIDILVLSTGYRSPSGGGDPGSRTNIEILGRDGRKISDKWHEEGISTFQSTCTNGFPNLFFQSAIQGGATASYSHVIDVASEHIAAVIAQAHKTASSKMGKVVIEPTVAAEAAWGMRIAQTAAFFSAVTICTPGYLNLEGEMNRMPDASDYAAMVKKAKAAIWQGGIVDFTRLLEKWRSEGHLDGLAVTVEA